MVQLVASNTLTHVLYRPTHINLWLLFCINKFPYWFTKVTGIYNTPTYLTQEVSEKNIMNEIHQQVEMMQIKIKPNKEHNNS